VVIFIATRFIIRLTFDKTLKIYAKERSAVLQLCFVPYFMHVAFIVI